MNAERLILNAKLLSYCRSSAIPVNITDNQWHHLGVTRRDSGRTKLFLDGSTRTDTYFKRNYKIEGGGDFLLGGDLDGWDGSINLNHTQQTFEGEISHVNVWSLVKKGEPMEQLARMCGEETGSLLAWPDFKEHIFGNVQVLQSSGCHVKQSR